MSRILLVDNEPDVIDALRASLEVEGHHVLTALDGCEAFEVVTGRIPDLVVTDWKMPHVDGLALCRLLRENRFSVRLPVIVMSADPPPTDRRLVLYNAYIRKPVSVQEVLALVSSLTQSQH